jgi:hypothetical protein
MIIPDTITTATEAAAAMTTYEAWRRDLPSVKAFTAHGVPPWEIQHPPPVPAPDPRLSRQLRRDAGPGPMVYRADHGNAPTPVASRVVGADQRERYVVRMPGGAFVFPLAELAGLVANLGHVRMLADRCDLLAGTCRAAGRRRTADRFADESLELRMFADDTEAAHVPGLGRLWANEWRVLAAADPKTTLNRQPPRPVKLH